MQSIYDEGVGDLNKYKLKKIVKKQNRRNPRIVIEIANKFRNDKITQIPSRIRMLLIWTKMELLLRVILNLYMEKSKRI